MEEARPPYIRFETRAVEDRAASIEAGAFRAKNVDFAIITPSGTKDEREYEVEPWLQGWEKAARDSRLPQSWVDGARRKFEFYKKGQEIPEEGTAILSWPVVSPAQAATIIAANIRTVEDLAAASDSGLNLIGMGGIGLRDQARTWLASAEDTGKVAARLNKLEKENESLKGQVTGLTDKLAKAQLELAKAPA
jgi:hypothetical protein